ncbi:MAG: hypothetical protein M1822_010124 [Bathelium mastoideum]|nr:MAG: hypothetical protein M1822_010124 [Bathelium mastoideum]
MVKRPLEEEDDSDRQQKKLCLGATDRISGLSDELLLRVLSNLSVTTLNLCQRISRRFHALAADSQLWKAAYYERFVRPRALRLRTPRDALAENLPYSSKLARWLDEESFLKKGKEMNWKRQYKIRHNWARGSCGVSEIQVTERPPIPQLLVRFHEGVVYTVDFEDGLQAWSPRGEQKLVARTLLSTPGEAQKSPTSLAINTRGKGRDAHQIAIGFENGAYCIYELRIPSREFVCLYESPLSSSGMLSAIALATPYLLVMSEKQRLSLYRFEEESGRLNGTLDPPRLLFSFKSHTSWPPLTLSIRLSGQGLTASIAYAVPTYLSGWSVGIQEMCLNLDGELLESRVATAMDPTFRSLSTVHREASPARSHGEGSSEMQFFAKPTSLSYSHPYLLVSHPDNTLTLYLVTSTASSLSIGAGRRLWGHTSSVSGAEVGGRGKAVSVSCRGEELRLWELEGGMASAAMRRRLTSGELSIPVRPGKRASRDDGSELAVAKGFVGFDEENVVVLREKSRGRQALVVYDFT